MISIQQLVEICARPEWMRPDAGEDRQIKEAQIKGVGVTWLEERGGAGRNRAVYSGVITWSICFTLRIPKPVGCCGMNGGFRGFY